MSGLKFSQITEMILIDNPELYAKIQDIRKDNRQKLDKYTLKISLFAIVSFLLSFFSAVKIALWLPESLYFLVSLIPIGMMASSIYVVNAVRKDYMKLIDYDLFFNLYFQQKNNAPKKGR